MAPDAADDVAQDPRRLVTGWPLARTQQRQHRLGGRRVEDVDGLKAVLVVMGVEQCQLLAAVDGIRGIVNVEPRCVGARARSCRKTDRSSSAPCAPVRAMMGRFSSLDKVGCDIRSRPLSGRRPQASLNAGSKRSTSRSSQSSYPQAMANMRAPIMSAYEWVVLAGSRASDRQPARRAARPRRFSISRSTSTPPSDDSRPPSNRTHSSLFSTGDSPGRQAVISSMVSRVSLLPYGLGQTPESYGISTV